MKEIEKQAIEEKVCKNCIHYQMCVDTFRKAKQDGEILLLEEEAYFAKADGCDFYADKRIYRKQSEGEWLASDVLRGDEDWKRYACSLCKHMTVAYYKDVRDLSKFCPNCGAKMNGIKKEFNHGGFESQALS